MFKTSIRQRRLVRRMAGYFTEPVKAQARVLMHRDQRWTIGGHPVVLPPGHFLPWFQRRDQTYDTYATALVAELCRGRTVTVIDLGANVGDTAVALLACDPDLEVISVEGNSEFTRYFRRNVAQFSGRVTLIEAFVGPITGVGSYVSHGTSGAFVGDDDATGTWVSPAELMDAVPDDRDVVWKSDIDGFDIHLLSQNWDEITGRSGALWFEYDPAHTLGEPADVEVLIGKVAHSGRHVLAFDNLGRQMFSSADPAAIEAWLIGSTAWMRQQVEGHTTVPYVDIWALRADWLTPAVLGE